jgi:hypothetical protein
MRWRAVGSFAARRFGSVTQVARRLPRRISDLAHASLRRLDLRARRLLAATGEAARLWAEFVSLSARSAGDAFRSMVLLRRLHVRRAAVIYSTGCAALRGEDRRFEGARAELRLLDELITAAGGRTAFVYAPGGPEAEETALADVPTEESVLAQPGTVAIPALRRGR